MSFLSPIKKAGGWIWRQMKKAVGVSVDYVKTHEDELLDDLKALAIPIVEAITHLDLNQDGRVAATREIIAAAEQTGLKWGKALLRNGKENAILALKVHYTDADLSRYLALARFSLAIIKKFGVNFVPRNRVLNGVIEAVVNDSPDK